MSSILIRNAEFIVTPEKVWEKRSIYIEDSRIVEFSKNEADVVIEGDGMVVVPGLINAHTHIPMTFLRGIAEDKPLAKWLEEDIWPRERKINAKLVYNAALLGIAEALRYGTVGFVDMYFYEEEIAKAASEMGIRAWVGYGLIDLGNAEKREEEIKKAVKLIKAVKRLKDPRIRGIVTPHAPYTCSPELLIEAHEIAVENSTIYHIHISETREEVEKVRRKYGKTPLKYLDSLGVVDGYFVGAHGVWLTPGERVILARRGGSVVHCPSSNLKLGSGIAPVKKYIGSGINIALGTDGPASNNDLDMWEEMRLMAFLQKLKDTSFPGIEALKAATANGARALRFDGGIIREGAPADLVLVDLNSLSFQPVLSRQQVANNLVYACSGRDVKYVIVNGELKVKNGRLVDEEKVERAMNETRKLAEKLGIL